MNGHSPQPKAATNTKQAQNNLDYITLPKPCQTPNKQLTKQPARKKASLLSAPTQRRQQICHVVSSGLYSIPNTTSNYHSCLAPFPPACLASMS